MHPGMDDVILTAKCGTSDLTEGRATHGTSFVSAIYPDAAGAEAACDGRRIGVCSRRMGRAERRPARSAGASATPQAAKPPLME